MPAQLTDLVKAQREQLAQKIAEIDASITSYRLVVDPINARIEHLKHLKHYLELSCKAADQTLRAIEAAGNREEIPF